MRLPLPPWRRPAQAPKRRRKWLRHGLPRPSRPRLSAVGPGARPAIRRVSARRAEAWPAQTWPAGPPRPVAAPRAAQRNRPDPPAIRSRAAPKMRMRTDRRQWTATASCSRCATWTRARPAGARPEPARRRGNWMATASAPGRAARTQALRAAESDLLRRRTRRLRWRALLCRHRRCGSTRSAHPVPGPGAPGASHHGCSPRRNG
ncbi:hypothetical protein D3C71_1317340 [compost metagenome]